MNSIARWVFAAALISEPAVAQELVVGKSYSGAVKVASPNSGTYLPLPDGIWTLTSLEETRTTGNSPMLNGRLVQIDGDRRVLGAVSFSVSNTTNSDWHWTVPAYCSRRDIYFVTAPQTHRRGGEILCWGVNHIGMTPGSKAGKSVTDFYQWVARNTVGMPRTMIAVEFYRASGAKYLRAQYFKNPEIDGFPEPHSSAWRESEWHKDRVVGNAARVAYLEGRKAWGEQWLPILQASFRGQPVDRVSTPINHIKPSAPASPLERQLEELKAVHDKQLITEDEYAARKKAILGGR